jgi:AraC-like DNA-binding protein
MEQQQMCCCFIIQLPRGKEVKVLDYKETILICLKYIEDHLKEPLTPESICVKTGYSLYHFSRIFRDQMSVSIMEYVKDRRLTKASEDIVQGKKILEAAIEYGYETHSGFTKAFRNRYGFSPTLLRAVSIQKLCLNTKSGGNCIMSLFLNQTEMHSTKEELFQILLKTIKDNKIECDLKKVENAYTFAAKAHDGQFRKSGDEYVTHPLNTAILLADMEADEDTILSGILHDVFEKNTNVGEIDISAKFSPKIASLVQEITSFNSIYHAGKKIDEFDEKVIMVKLADRLHNMRTIEFMDPKFYEQKAKETIEIFSPIAAKFEKTKLKLELNDLAMKYL